MEIENQQTNMNNEAQCNNKAGLDQNNIPIEELLGSVTTYNNVEGSYSKSQQLRTSARVFKKMKLDLAVSSSILEPKKENVKEEVKQESKRLWKPTWSQEDKNLFFEALNEYGKDFESIHCYISNKLRKRGLPESVMKTKDQIRHFYYRTFHKVSKHLKFSEDIKKIAQELYALINYGELRKKIGSVSEKTCVKLNELVYRGVVAIRLKGKTVRIKTPMCRALRKLNQLDEKHDDLKLPTRVNVNLIPKNMNSWLKVQGVSQNPRVKAALPLQRRLGTLMDFLNCKWKSVSETAYENALHTYGNVIDECLPENTSSSKSEVILRLSPRPKANIEFPTINLSEYLTSQSICLNAFEERVGVKTPGEQLWLPKGGLKKTGPKRSRNESCCEKVSTNSQKGQNSSSANIDNNENCISEILFAVNKDISENIAVLGVENADRVDFVEHKVSNDVRIDDVKEDLDADIKLRHIVNVRKGWTSENCGTLTVGELYLMFGSNSCLTLEYSWDDSTKIDTKIEVESNGKDNQQQIEESKGEMEEKYKDKTESDNNLNRTLTKLLSVAKLHYRKNIIRCPCGHVCGNKSNNILVDKPASSKVNKTTCEKNNSSEKVCAADSTLTVSNVTSSVLPIIIRSTLQPVDVFRQPVSSNFRAQLNSIQRLSPRYCNRRGRRPRSKQVVVERRLPLLPNKIDDGHQIVQMNIISPNGPRVIAPKLSNVDKSERSVDEILPEDTEGRLSLNTESSKVTTFGSEIRESSKSATSLPVLDITDNATTLSRIGSPTSISNLLDMALAAPDCDRENREESGISSFMGLLSDNMTSTPPTSPSRILKENENQWLNSEVSDFSFSSFLGHLESPIKMAQSACATTEDTHLSPDVDAQLQSLLSESSIDYMAKFADLAARVDQK